MQLIYHSVSPPWVLPPPPCPFLVRKRMEIMKKRIINISHKDHKRAFSTEKDGGERTAWGCKEQPRACLQGKKSEVNGESQTIATTDHQMPVWGSVSGTKQHWRLSPYNTHLATLLPFALGPDTILHTQFSVLVALHTRLSWDTLWRHGERQAKKDQGRQWLCITSSGSQFTYKGKKYTVGWHKYYWIFAIKWN